VTSSSPAINFGSFLVPIFSDPSAVKDIKFMGDKFARNLCRNLSLEKLENLEVMRSARYSDAEIMHSLNLPLIPPLETVFNFLGRCSRCSLFNHLSKDCPGPCASCQQLGFPCRVCDSKRPNYSPDCSVCLGCGHSKSDCKLGPRCYICKQLGHVARVCPDRFVPNLEQRNKKYWVLASFSKCNGLGHSTVNCQAWEVWRPKQKETQPNQSIGTLVVSPPANSVSFPKASLDINCSSPNQSECHTDYLEVHSPNNIITDSPVQSWHDAVSDNSNISDRVSSPIEDANTITSSLTVNAMSFLSVEVPDPGWTHTMGEYVFSGTLNYGRVCF
jgi:hypothetical protein